MTYADYVKFSIQYVEWITLAGLGTNMILSATDAADYHLGKYTASEGVFIDPNEKAGLVGWTSAEFKPAFNDKDPSKRPGGSIGDVTYFADVKGLFEKSGVIMVDSVVIMKQVDSKKKDYETYEKSKATYEKDLGEYDKEIDKEKKREGDIFTATFEAKVTIREKPNQPA